MVKGSDLFFVSGGADVLSVRTSIQTTRAVLSFAAQTPADGWTLCLEGTRGENSITATEAHICVNELVSGACDVKSRIADSRLF